MEYWVQQDYFPAKECIQISREMKNYMAEARLVEKLGDGSAAIQIYLDYLDKIDPKRLTD